VVINKLLLVVQYSEQEHEPKLTY